MWMDVDVDNQDNGFAQYNETDRLFSQRHRPIHQNEINFKLRPRNIAEIRVI